MTKEKLIFLEFNELCPELMQRWMSQGKLSNFQRLYSSSQVFEAWAETEVSDWLEPWIQWYSMHTGISCAQHQVQHLTDGPRMTGRITDMWQALLAAGLRVGNGGSMNAAGFRVPGSFFIPDTWCTTEPPYPEELAAYQRLVLKKVQESSNRDDQLSQRDYMEFLKFVTRHGLSSRSVRAIVGQLMSERWDRKRSWRRATLLDQLQRDVFFHYWRRLQPDFSTFFLNSTAHYQHSFFHLAAPERFDFGSVPGEDAAHSEAVLFGFQRMDELIGDFMALEEHGARLVFVTALSQQPWARAGLVFYRLYDVADLLAAVGVHPEKIMPVMAQQYVAQFGSQADADAAKTRLGAIRLGAQPLFEFGAAEPGCIFFGVACRTVVPADVKVTFPSNERPTIRFAELCYRLEQSKMTVHHPRSMLWVHTGKHAVHGQKISLLDIFPTLLDYYGVDIPQDAGFTREGVSVLPRIGMDRYRRDRPSIAA